MPRTLSHRRGLSTGRLPLALLVLLAAALVIVIPPSLSADTPTRVPRPDTANPYGSANGTDEDEPSLADRAGAYARSRQEVSHTRQTQRLARQSLIARRFAAEAEAEHDPDLLDARQDARRAREAFEAARQQALAAIQARPDHRTARRKVEAIQRRIERLRRDPRTTRRQIIDLAAEKLRAADALTRLESEALDKVDDLPALREAWIEASRALDRIEAEQHRIAEEHPAVLDALLTAEEARRERQAAEADHAAAKAAYREARYQAWRRDRSQRYRYLYSYYTYPYGGHYGYGYGYWLRYRGYAGDYAY